MPTQMYVMENMFRRTHKYLYSPDIQSIVLTAKLATMDSMKCPFCSSQRLRVIDKRGSGESIRRRRQCGDCGKRFTTYERVSLQPVMVTKKDGRREEFNRDKLLSGLLKACEKRPVARELLESAVDEIENELRDMGEEVPTTAIGDIVMKRLKALDNVAYVRFASVYMDFQSIAAFEEAIKGLKK